MGDALGNCPDFGTLSEWHTKVPAADATDVDVRQGGAFTKCEYPDRARRVWPDVRQLSERCFIPW